MAQANYFDQFDDARVSKRAREKDVETGQQAAIRSQTIQQNAATIPYAAPQAASDLENAQNRAKYARLEQTEKLRQNFNGLKPVRDYADTVPQLSAALRTAPNSAGDQMLLYAAAKIADPGSVVRESEQASWAQTQPVVQQLQARFNKEIFSGGQFTQGQRNIIRQELIRALRERRVAYERERRNYERTAKRYGLDPSDVVGEHAGEAYREDMRAYDASRRKQGAILDKRAGLDDAQPRDKTVGVLETPPEGARVAGEDIKAYRYTPEQEGDLKGILRAPDFSPEQYADTATQMALDNKSITPEGADKFRADALTTAQGIAEMPAEERAAAKFDIDYSEADKAATENAGLFESVAQGFRNLPESGAQLIQGLAALPVDSLLSALQGERVGSIKTTTDLAADLAAAAGVGDADGETLKALGDMLDERYGGIDNIKRTAVTDPAGLAGDLSILFTAGGSAAARAPGTIGKVGQAVAKAGEALDPLALAAKAVKGTPAAYNAVASKAPGALEGVKNLPSEIAGFPSGVGGASLREATKAGFERGRAGAPTARSESFTQSLRNPGSASEDLIAQARDALSGMRQSASQKYQAEMQKFGQNPVPLDINKVRMEMARIKPKNYDTMLDAPRRPSEHVAWEQMNDTVEHYAGKAAQDPSLLEPLAMDQFKQDLYDIGSKVGGQYDRDAARIAGTAYNAVKKELVDHDPIYAATMKDYETAVREVQQIENSFGLRAARGKEPNIDSAMRKLQSIMRNNAYTNYGTRAAQGKRLSAMNPAGELEAGLAGQMGSSWTPRGLQGPTALGIGGGAGVVGGLPMMGTAALAAPLLSPRVMSEAAYGLGRMAGTGTRAAQPALDVLSKVYGLYDHHPETALLMSRIGSGAQATEREKQDELLRRYGVNISVPGIEDIDRYTRGD